jgi:LDH2 family malate/lactate/ureidoglycolate dehydrogenase
LRVKKHDIKTVAQEILQALGTPENVATCVIGSLIRSDQHGASTHGLSLLPLYRDMIDAGVIQGAEKPIIRAMQDSTASIDGRGAFGQVTGKMAVEWGLKLMQKSGTAAIGIADGTHLGRLGEWAEAACDEGAIFLGYANTGGGALTVAGAKGVNRVLAPNPIAFGIPTDAALPHNIIVDFATSQVSGSRIREVANAREQLNPGWVIGNDGSPTHDPADFLKGNAALLPLGGDTAGHKGFGLMLVAEMLASVAGGAMAGEKNREWFSNGAFFVFVDIHRFVAREQWRERVRAFSHYIAGRGYRLPGQGQSGVNANNDKELDLGDHTMASILKIAAELGVDCRGLTAPTINSSVTQSW